ncbi:dsDNA nuclease domain-containing protein [Thiobacillus denitrificans]|uniref:dsDNA nuclease domain-containing protein n=1 Tax=Thiobacillus denitrificans TaxID=36861 RepID=UPI0003A21928|nr:dsDNA nuclease domain-containing protein [Thiobacillus denitrificans]
MLSRSSKSKSNSDSLEDLLRDRPSDEKQGATATQGFVFQQWWAALCVAELLRTPNDFAVGMEVKEDVALLDSSNSPTKVEFCQVKKNERAVAWTLKELHKQGQKLKVGGHEPSTLAKLYKRRHEFLGHPTKLKFVSNTSFKVPAEDERTVNSHVTNLGDLTPKQQNVIKEALASQLGISASEVNLDEFSLQRTNLPLGEQEVFVGGMLSQLYEEGHIPFQVAQPTVAARILASELQTRASRTNYARTYDELKERLFTRSDALRTLTLTSQAKPTLNVLFDEAIERLNIEQYDFMSIKRMKAERINVLADAVDRSNMLFRNLAAALVNARESTLNAASQGTTLGALMETLVSNAKQITPSEFVGRSPDYVNSLALLVLNDGIDIDVCTPEAGKKSEEEQQ